MTLKLVEMCGGQLHTRDFLLCFNIHYVMKILANKEWVKVLNIRAILSDLSNDLDLGI